MISIRRHRTRTAPAPQRQPPRERQLGPSRRPTQQEPFASRSQEKAKPGIFTKRMAKRDATWTPLGSQWPPLGPQCVTNAPSLPYVFQASMSARAFLRNGSRMASSQRCLDCTGAVETNISPFGKRSTKSSILVSFWDYFGNPWAHLGAQGRAFW